MIDIAALLGHMDEIVERAVIGDESCNVLKECRDRIAEQFGYSWCDNHEEWVTGGISAERAWCDEVNIDALMERALRERDKANEIIHATGKVIGPHYTGHPQELPDCVRVALDEAWAAEEHRRVTMLADIQALAARAEQSERERDEAAKQRFARRVNDEVEGTK